MRVLFLFTLCALLWLAPLTPAEALKPLPPKPTVMLFWQKQCPACHRSLLRLPELVEEYEAVQFVLVALHDEATAKEALRRFDIPESVQHMALEENQAETLIELGNPGQYLPFTVALYPDGNQCQAHIGILTEEQLDLWKRHCWSQW